jgi:Ca2+-binding EF-hand superfamily protein
MGNSGSTPSGNMGISAMAVTTPNITKSSMKEIMKQIKDLPTKPTLPFMITKVDYESITRNIIVFEEPDLEILDALFDLFDIKGDGTILYRDLIAGLSCCLVMGSVESKLLLSFELYDVKGNHNISRVQLLSFLSAINNTACYFGDHVLNDKLVEGIVNDTFYSLAAANDIEETLMINVGFDQCIEYLAQHESVKLFINGEGSKLFQQ